MTLYSQILDHAGPAFGTILRHIRDHPEDNCVFHCTGMRPVMEYPESHLLGVSWQGSNRSPGRYSAEASRRKR